jgi:thiol-disulfide isomerase/thioredoxin
MKLLLSILLAIPGASAVTAHDVIGRPAPGWTLEQWVQGGPLPYEQLRGRVVLVRWWTGPGCPYCRASAPYLNSWHRAYADKGLTIVGLYHHKAPHAVTSEHVARQVERLGFEFPIAIDLEWRTLRRWWLEGHRRSFTSVTFLLDQDGIIRRIHPGGSYDENEAETLETDIRELLRITGDRPGTEPTPPPE